MPVKAFQGMTFFFSTPCHTTRRVLSLVTMYPFSISSAQFHLQFFLWLFLIRKATCSAGKFSCTPFNTFPFLCFVSACFLTRAVFEDDKGPFPDHRIFLPESTFVFHN